MPRTRAAVGVNVTRTVPASKVLDPATEDPEAVLSDRETVEGVTVPASHAVTAVAVPTQVESASG